MSTKEDTLEANRIDGPSPEKATGDRLSPANARDTNFGKRSCPSPSPKKLSPWRSSSKKGSPWRSSPRRAGKTSPYSRSPREHNSRRRSWSRSSLKGNKRRQSLPPIHHDIIGLSRTISLELLETERLSLLLQSCFQFSVQKLEESLKRVDGFDTEAFQVKVLSVSKELQHFIEKLGRNGTLQKCTEEPARVETTPNMEASKTEINEYIASFSEECEKWDKLLLSYQNAVQEMSRQLERVKLNDTQMESTTKLGTSQDEVICSKPNYQGILTEQSHTFGCMELVMDELQESVNLLHSFMDDVSEYLRNISVKLERKSFKQMENSPVRKFLKISKS